MTANENFTLNQPETFSLALEEKTAKAKANLEIAESNMFLADPYDATTSWKFGRENNYANSPSPTYSPV